MSKALIDLDLFFRQTLSPELVISQDKHDLGLKASIQTFDAFVRCTLMGNQPWPQFQNGIWERSIELDFFHLIRISEMGVMNFADKVEDFNEVHFSKSVCKITELKSRIEHESQSLTLVHD